MHDAKFLNLIENLKASYWFLPSIMAVLAIVLSFLTTGLDSWLGADWPLEIAWMHANRPEGARAVLSTIAGSMITVASVTFSMTITSVSYATSQIGPRLIGNFMRDRANQITLGTFIATFLYCLMVLRTIVGEGEASSEGRALEAFVPHVSMLIAIVFALSSVAVLIFFIHHVPESINVSNIVSRVGHSLNQSIDVLFPENIGKGKESSEPLRPGGSPKCLPDNFFNLAFAISSKVDGYIQVLNQDDLVELATKYDLLLRLEYRPGDFAAVDDVLLYAYPAASITEEIENKVRACFAFGNQRTQTQDILFLADELIEIIARALSPGVNDPFTAILALDWLQCALQKMSSRHVPDAYRIDDKGALRVVAHAVDFKTLTNTIFNKTLCYIARDRNAALRTMKMIGEIFFKTGHEPYRAILLLHAENLAGSCESLLALQSDRAVISSRLQDIHKAMNDPAYLHALRDSQAWLGGSA